MTLRSFYRDALNQAYADLDADETDTAEMVYLREQITEVTELMRYLESEFPK